MIGTTSALAELQYVAGAGSGPSVALALVTGGEVAIVIVVFTSASMLLAPLVRAAARRLEASGEVPKVPTEVADRLARIETAVDAISLEVERISESQRFVTQLLSKPETPRLRSADE